MKLVHCLEIKRIFLMIPQMPNLNQFTDQQDSPSIVFRIQQEVSANNCHTYSDNSKNKENKEHETIDIVDFVGPE